MGAIRLTNRTPILEATTSAVAWTIDPLADFDINFVSLIFASAPTVTENVTVTFKSKNGTAYDTLRRSINVKGKTTLSIEDIGGMEHGDSLLIEFANTDGISITGVSSFRM